MKNKIKTELEIAAITECGAMLAEVLRAVTQAAVEGITGIELDELAKKELKALGGKPAFLGYNGFPNTICISINDAVVHGIPNRNPLQKGDVVGFDYGVTYRGMITDAARTIIVGTDSTSEVQKLVNETKRSLDNAIKAVKHGARVGDIASAAQSVLDAANLGIVRDLVGHGVGHQLHEEPEIPNYGIAGSGPELVAGMTIAIEPMATLADWRVVLDPDHWTIRTRDGSLAAHFEDTILVTKNGAKILTR